MSTRISQDANFRADFGYVHRSSAIFYYRQSSAPEFRTTISFMNYWPLKRGNEVAVIASIRNLDGSLVRREQLTFTAGHVQNYSPMRGADFEGSVEVEAFANANLVIPYAAVVGVYETARGVTFVHSYARAYSRHEVEEGRTIVEGEEGCWTLRDSADRRSFAIFHNGPEPQPAQIIRLVVKNSKGETRAAEIQQAELPPYATVKIVPAALVTDLPGFLAGSPGFGTLSFRLKEGFTRMLVGNEALDGSDLQVTHSNFNYSKHETDLVTEGDRTAYMYVSSFPDLQKVGIVYPDSDPGAYFMVRGDGERVGFRSGEAVFFDVHDDRPVKFERQDGRGLPSRIVTALVGDKAVGAFPSECSLGVVHHKRPPKKMWWGACAAAPWMRSRIAATPITAVYGDLRDEQTARVTLYAEKSKKTLERTLGRADLASLSRGVYVDELFPDASALLGDALGYFTLTSEYGGLWCFSTLETKSGGFAFEHGF